MKIILELDNDVTSTFDANTLQDAQKQAWQICEDYQTGGVLVVDGVDVGEYDYCKGELFYTCL